MVLKNIKGMIDAAIDTCRLAILYYEFSRARDAFLW